jgi:hypothetical protein
MIRPIAVGGTGESYPGDPRTEMPDPLMSMLSFITEKLDEEYYLPGRWVGYPASYGDPMPYETSVQEALDNLDPVVQAALTAEEQVVLLGYSQGASVVRRYLSAIRAGEYGDPEGYVGLILGAACVADPYRPEGVVVGYEPGGYGIAGTTPQWEDSFLLEVAAHRDPICAAPYNSLLRTVADLSGFMSTDIRNLQGWMKAMMKTIQDRGWQNANLDWGQFWLVGQRVNEAIDMAGGYLPRIEYKTMPWLPPIVINPGGGRHTCYGMEKMPNSQYTYCEMLALELNSIANRLEES